MVLKEKKTHLLIIIISLTALAGSSFVCVPRCFRIKEDMPQDLVFPLTPRGLGVGSNSCLIVKAKIFGAIH